MPIDKVLSPSGVSSGTGAYAVNTVTHKLYFPTGVGWAPDGPPNPVYMMSDEPGPAKVVINKVELNPLERRDVPSNQWVELYNNGSSEVNISNWTITSTRPRSAIYGSTAHIPSGTKLPPRGRYVFETPSVGEPWNWLQRAREVITLRDAQGRLVDWTPELTDDKSGGTPETWQRFPGGKNTRSLSDWVLR